MTESRSTTKPAVPQNGDLSEVLAFYEKRAKALEYVARALRDWVDAVPKDLQLPAMPGFDRDWADSIIEGGVEEAEAPRHLQTAFVLPVAYAEALQREAELMELSPDQALRQALRTYQLVNEKSRKGVPVDLSVGVLAKKSMDSAQVDSPTG